MSMLFMQSCMGKYIVIDLCSTKLSLSHVVLVVDNSFT